MVFPSCIVFLGNPGLEYEQTRHNFGWMAARQFENQLKKTPTEINFVLEQPLVWGKKFDSYICSFTIDLKKITLVLPQTFMNLSGVSVKKCCDFYKIDPESLLVVHDDLEVNFGEIIYRKGGGPGGHNGLRSVDASLKTQAYLRCRLGVGRPLYGNVSSFVLSRFTDDEQAVLPLILQKFSESLFYLIHDGAWPKDKIVAI